MSRKKRIHSHYEWRISPGRQNHEVLDWADAESQIARFRVLTDHIQLNGKKLLDVGSGLGDLWEFLRQNHLDVDYTGIDLLKKMVDESRRRHPNARFIHADVFTDSPFGPDSFDVVYCSGIFNLNLGNNLEFLPIAVGRLLSHAREHLVFNLLSARTPWRDEKYFFYNPADVIELLAPLGCKMQIVDNYLPNDFTVICKK